VYELAQVRLPIFLGAPMTEAIRLNSSSRSVAKVILSYLIFSDLASLGALCIVREIYW